MRDPMDMTEAQTGSLPAALTLGAVDLTVSDLDRAIEWYERSLGLRVLARDDGSAELGTDETVVILHEDPQAHPPGRTAGLYHYALLYPSREELARAAVRLAETRTPIQGASDHRTHEAIYLPDADGNGIELAADRPREVWPSDLGYAGGPAPLDFDALLGAIEGEAPAAEARDGMRMGHLHLHVGDVEEGKRFYRDVLGFEVQADLGSAAFVSAGGYHHHLGFNTWKSAGGGPQPDGVAGLHHVALNYPTRAGLADAVRRLQAVNWPLRQLSDHGTHEAVYISDPDGNDLELAWDRPVDQWPVDADGHIPPIFGELDLEDLLTER